MYGTYLVDQIFFGLFCEWLGNGSDFNNILQYFLGNCHHVVSVAVDCGIFAAKNVLQLKTLLIHSH